MLGSVASSPAQALREQKTGKRPRAHPGCKMGSLRGSPDFCHLHPLNNDQSRPCLGLHAHTGIRGATVSMSSPQPGDPQPPPCRATDALFAQSRESIQHPGGKGDRIAQQRGHRQAHDDGDDGHPGRRQRSLAPSRPKVLLGCPDSPGSSPDYWVAERTPRDQQARFRAGLCKVLECPEGDPKACCSFDRSVTREPLSGNKWSHRPCSGHRHPGSGMCSGSRALGFSK